MLHAAFSIFIIVAAFTRGEECYSYLPSHQACLASLAMTLFNSSIVILRRLGLGNNAIFLMEKGYEVHGVDVAPSFKSLLKKNMELHHVDTTAADGFSVISPDSTELDFPDNHFDFIFSNQVLYYLPSIEHLQKVCAGFKRVLRPGGVVFFTMMGPRNYYITHHLKAVHANGTIYDVRVEEKGHRLEGVREVVLVAKDEKHLCKMFSAFEPVTVGYFDQKMFDLHSNFHWIFAGRKKA